MRGRFTPEATGEEWCERRLLSRIHHYTLKRLRAEIEPVAARDFLRFLFDWQHVAPDRAWSGPKALDGVVAQLEGFEAPAGAWESEILPARLADYEPAWLDERCLAGHAPGCGCVPATAGRRRRRPAPVRTTPITLLPRRHAALWTSLSPADDAQPSPRAARNRFDCMKEQRRVVLRRTAGARGLLRSQLEEALAELVALGLVTSDSFGGLRALLVPSSERSRRQWRRRRRTARTAWRRRAAGRWSGARARRTQAGDAIEHVARTLLRRYGVVFWRLLERERPWLPPWRELLRVYRRLESRGEIRGGRFVAGFSGEQFALPEAIGMLREIRRGRRRMNGGGLGRRSAQPGRHPDARGQGSPPWPATGCCIATACRPRPYPPVRSGSATPSIPRPSGLRERRCCAERGARRSSAGEAGDRRDTEPSDVEPAGSSRGALPPQCVLLVRLGEGSRDRCVRGRISAVQGSINEPQRLSR